MSNRKKGKILSLALILLVMISTISMVQIHAKGQPNTIYVDDDNINDPYEDGTPGHPFDKIQEGVDAANSGDIVSVETGSYSENLMINKSLTLNGKGRFYTNIYGDEYWPVITVKNTSELKIEGFSIYNINAALSVGIFVENSVLITIEGNYIRADWVGIGFEYSSSGFVTGNLITNKDGETGVHLRYSNNITIYENEITSGKNGIYFYESHKNIIRNNKLLSHGYGLRMINSYFNNVSENQIEDNVIGISGGGHNKIYHNNFVDNIYVPPILIDRTNTFDNGYPSGGNYWSDFEERYPDVKDVYSGPNQNETGSDGIWDHPYEIYEDNIDNYPLTNPYVPMDKPIAILSADKQTVFTNEDVIFDASASYDPDGSVVTYWYEFGDGFDSGWTTDTRYTWRYSDVGAYYAKLMVKDDDGLVSDWSNRVKITVISTTNQPPTAYIDSIFPNPARYDELVNFQGHGQDSDGFIEEYRWTSNIDGFLSSLASFGTASLSLGEHEISFEVRDDDGAWSTPVKATLTIREWVVKPELLVEVYSDKDELHANLNEVEITITVKNIGTYTARDVSINLELPYNFETNDPTNWIRYIQPDEELTFKVLTKVKGCLPGNFTVTGTYKDREDNTIEIPVKSVAINVKEIVLLEYSEDPPYTDVNISPEWVELSKSWGGAENVAAAIWVMTLLEKVDIEEVKLETVLEHLDEVYYFIQYLLDMEEPVYTILPMLIDAIGGIAINTWRLRIDASGYGDILADGTMNYRAIWPIETFSWFLKKVAKTFIEIFLDKIKEGIPTILTSKYIVVLQDPVGKLYLDITGTDMNVSIHEAKGISLALLETPTNFNCIVNGTDAHQDIEEYNLTYITIVIGEVQEEWSGTYNITKGEIQKFSFELNEDGSVKNIIEPPERGNNIWTFVPFVIVTVAIIIVAIVLLYLVVRRKKKQEPEEEVAEEEPGSTPETESEPQT